MIVREINAARRVAYNETIKSRDFSGDRGFVQESVGGLESATNT